MYVLNQPFAPTRLSYLGKIPLMNQAVERGVYYAPKYATHRVLHGMGQQDVTFNAPLLIGGVALLLGAFYLLGGRKGGQSGRKLARYSAQRSRLSEKIKALEA